MPGAGPNPRPGPLRAGAVLAALALTAVFAVSGGIAGPAAAAAGRVRTAAPRVGTAHRPPITITVHPTVTPDRAGTPAHPQGIHLEVRMTFGIPVGYNPPLVSRIQVWFPRGGLYEGGRYPTCARRVLDAVGPTACPAGSIMGHGGGLAMADRTPTHPRITIVNGGARRVWFYTVLENPARVQEPLPGTVTALHGRWAYELSVPIPRNLQVVAGIPVVLHSLQLSAGRGSWLATTGCPGDRRWPWRGLGSFTDGQRIAAHGAVVCRPAGRG